MLPPIRLHHYAFVVRDQEANRRFFDDGYCESLYTTSPDGLRIEFTVDPNDIVAILALRKADAHSELARWLAGNHRPNNEIRRPTS